MVVNKSLILIFNTFCFKKIPYVKIGLQNRVFTLIDIMENITTIENIKNQDIVKNFAEYHFKN